MSDHSEPKILNLADLLREAERQREEARKTAPVERPWCPWPEVFNAGTCEENEAWKALQEAEDFLDGNHALMAFFSQDNVTGFRRSDGGYEFRLDQPMDDAQPLVLRVWMDENRVERAEVRRV